MNAANEFYIPMICGAQRFYLHVQLENDPNDSDSVWMATCSGFINLAESHAGFGGSVEQAVEALLEYGKPIEKNPENTNL